MRSTKRGGRVKYPPSAREPLRLSLATLCFLTLAAVPAADTRWAKSLRKELKKIEISGYRSIGLHYHQVSGDRSAFDTVNYFGQGQRRVTNIGQLQIVGHKVFGMFNFRASIQDDRYQDPQGQTFSLDYDQKGVQVNAGTLPHNLISGNAFVGLNKSLKGIAVGYKRGPVTARVLRSEATGSARTVSISGNNSAGPFYLEASQLVPGTERLQLNGVDLKPGEDYVINYEVGSVTLIQRVLALTDTLVASYEAFGFNDRKGTVQGVGVSLDMGHRQKVTVLGLGQMARGGGALSSRLEKFQGYGPASTPYTLQFEPQPGTPVLVRLDGVIQVLGTDYTFDPSNTAIFYFTRFVPSSSEVAVAYTPRAQSTASGDRANVGIQYSNGFQNKVGTGTLTLTQTTGKLSGPRKSSGIARGATFSLKNPRISLNASWRKVPIGFVAVESVGFNRNENAHSLRVDVQATDKLKWNVEERNSAIQTMSTLGKTSSGRSSTLAGGATYAESDTRNWTFSQTRMLSRTTLGASRLDQTSLFHNRRSGMLEWGLGYEGQSGERPLTQTTSTNVRLDGLKARATYFGNSQWSARGSASVVRVRSGDSSGTGRDYDLNMIFRPKPQLTFSSLYSVSDGGALAQLSGFSNGFGLGYDGNGFSNGSGNSIGSGATNLRSWSNILSYQASPRLGVSASYLLSRQTGNVSSNTETRSTSLGVAVDMLKGYSLNASLDQSSTQFLGSTLPRSTSTSIAAFLTASPSGKLRYQAGLNSYLAGGSSSFRQEGTTAYVTGLYSLAPRHNLIFEWRSARTTGYLGQQESMAGLTYQYRIWQDLSFNASYNFRNTRNLDPGSTTGAYRASSFDFELSYNFMRF